MSILPKNFDSWHETHYEVVNFITTYLHEQEHAGDGGNADKRAILQRQEDEGHAGLYELAKEWTNEFERLHGGREWDGEFFDAIENFCNEKNQQTVKP